MLLSEILLFKLLILKNFILAILLVHDQFFSTLQSWDCIKI